MSCWNRLFKRSSETRADFKRIVSEAQEALARGEAPRYSPAVGELLGLFWDDRAPIPLIVRMLLEPHFRLWKSLAMTPFEWTGSFCLDLVRLLREKHPEAPGDAETRYAAFVSALFMLMQALMLRVQIQKEQREPRDIAAPLWESCFKLSLAAHFAQRLLAVELHSLCCDLLLTADEVLVKLRNGGEGSSRFLLLHMSLTECLAALPPEEIPQFWERLKDPRTSREFWPIVRRMRDRRAIPLLLDALPELALDGQSAVIVALQQIGDARAVPALQALAADKSSLLAPIAEQAVAHIMKHSRDDAAQLLRPTDARHASRAGETLLRPASPAPDTNVRAEELLRPGSAPEE